MRKGFLPFSKSIDSSLIDGEGELGHYFQNMFGRCVFCVALILPTLAAQQAVQSLQAEQQANLSQEVQGQMSANSTRSMDTFAPASQSDVDIGDQIILQPAQKYQPFSAWTNWSVFWTNNAELLNDTKGSDTFLSGTVGFNYVPHLGNNLFANFSAEQGIFRYSRNGSLDFNSLNLKAGLIYVLRPLGDLTLFGDYTYDLLTARGFNKQIYADHVLSVGVRKTFAISRAHCIYTSASADFTIAGEPDYALRNEFALLMGYQLGLTQHLKFDFYYRIAALDYTASTRADFNQLIGSSISYELTNWLTLQALSTIGINTSNESIYSYFAANLGGGIGVLVNF